MVFLNRKLMWLFILIGLVIVASGCRDVPKNEAGSPPFPIVTFEHLVARLEEEKRRDPSISLDIAINRTIQTYGKSIIYIAGTLVIGLLIWALSGLKFQAQMGMMLAIILFLNCVGAVVLVPVLVLIFKPKFLTGTVSHKA